MPRITHPYTCSIDLASPSELVANTRNGEEIARHIEAQEVIYKTQDDLKQTCAVLSSCSEYEFEVGVFCGSHMMPMDEGHFD